jgi:hypothetical protein
MGRAAACGAVNWFDVIRNFELMKNGPSLGKNRWAVSFAYRLNRLVCGEPLAVAPPCRSAPALHGWKSKA